MQIDNEHEERRVSFIVYANLEGWIKFIKFSGYKPSIRGFKIY